MPAPIFPISLNTSGYRSLISFKESNQEEKKDLLSIFEKEFGRTLNPTEMEAIRTWKNSGYEDEFLVQEFIDGDDNSMYVFTCYVNQKHKVKSLMISGGGSQSDEICQIAADVFNVPVSRIQTYETSSLGAAMVGFIATKVFKTPEQAVDSMVHITKTFHPNSEHVKEYEFYYKEYCKLYPKLKKSLATIKLHDEE